MRKGDKPVVYCEYAENGEKLGNLLEEAFRSYLLRSLGGDGEDKSALERTLFAERCNVDCGEGAEKWR